MSLILNFIKKSENENKKLIYILNNIFGIGLKNSKLICTTLGYDFNIKLLDILSKDYQKIDNIINIKYKFKILIELKNFEKENISNLKLIKTYKGIRHQYHLPVNGQNTHNNANTNKLL